YRPDLVEDIARDLVETLHGAAHPPEYQGWVVVLVGDESVEGHRKAEHHFTHDRLLPSDRSRHARSVPRWVQSPLPCSPVRLLTCGSRSGRPKIDTTRVPSRGGISSGASFAGDYSRSVCRFM